MMNNDFLYEPFPAFIFRTPLFPFRNLLKADYNNIVFNEALYLASPDFYREKRKNNNSEKNPDKKLSGALYKYYSRACARSTPFGLFAGCSVGALGDKSKIILDDEKNYRRYTRLDMNFLCAFIQYIEQLSQIKEQLKYYSNDSIYYCGDKIRYIEYFYRGLKRVHQIQSVDKADYLALILKKAEKGMTIKELAELISDNEISFEEAAEFIEELINNQILKSELEAGVTGEDVLEHLIEKLSKINNTTETVNLLKNIHKELQTIDSNTIGLNLEHYANIIELIKTVPVSYDENFLFQTDLFKPVLSACVSKNIIHDIQDALQFLMKLYSIKPGNSNLDKFKNKFSERYEEAEMALLQVMDPDIGIGYPIKKTDINLNPLIDDLAMPFSKEDSLVKLTNIECILLRKYIECIKNQSSLIELKEEDFTLDSINADIYAPTISVMCQILCDNEKREIFLQSVGGNAGNLLGRFCHLDKSVSDHVLNITSKEQELIPDKILAEIVHLPESRIGNIAFRPLLRKYEIHYLAKPGVVSDFQIPVSDLIICVRQNRVILKSKSMQKEIIPMLTNAHNFSSQSLPVYHFLCDMQFQNKQHGLSVPIYNLLNISRSFPRIIYKNTILSRSTWLVSEKELTIKDKSAKDDIIETIKEWRNKRDIPSKILIKESDNELYIDFDNAISIETFLTILYKRKEITICEFIYNDELSIISNGKQNFCGEFIFAFYKKEKL